MSVNIQLPRGVQFEHSADYRLLLDLDVGTIAHLFSVPIAAVGGPRVGRQTIPNTVYLQVVFGVNIRNTVLE